MIRLSFILLLGFWASTSMASETWKQLLGSSDFFIKETKELKPKSLSSTVNCRDLIKPTICLVDPPTQNEPIENRTCLPGGEIYAASFEQLYDAYPPVFQKMFCSLRRIFVEKEFFGTAYAGFLKDSSGGNNGAVIGIRKSVLDEQLSLNQWASWKEQLSFGGVVDSYTVSPNLPQISARATTSVNSFLYFVIAHEMGHLFDSANDLNKVESCDEKKPEPQSQCTMDKNSWGFLSWIKDRTPRPENEFSNRSALCFYWCNGSPLNESVVPQVYADIARTSFISTYATTQPWDDFADSLAYFAMVQNLGLEYQIDTRQGAIFNVINHLHSPIFAKKYEYLDQFLKRSDLKYP